MRDDVGDELSGAQDLVAEVAGSGQKDETTTRYLNNVTSALRRVEQLRDPAFRASYIAERENNPAYRPSHDSAGVPIPEGLRQRPSRAEIDDQLTKELNQARQDLSSATSAFKSYWTTRTQGSKPETRANAATADTAEELNRQRDANKAAGKGYYTDAELHARGRQDTADATTNRREDRLTRAQEDSNAIARANVAVSQANQRLAERKLGLENDLATGKLTLDQAKFDYEQVWNEAQMAQREHEQLLGQQRHEQTLAETARRTDTEATTSVRGQDITQRGQNLEAATKLGTEAGAAALGTFRASAPEGTTDFFNQGVRNLGSFSPGGEASMPQLPASPTVQVPRDIPGVGIRATAGILNNQAPVLPGQVPAPTLPAFNAGVAANISPEQAAAVDAQLQAGMTEDLQLTPEEQAAAWDEEARQQANEGP
jgi:stalled ribosome alternative rescue factor ArfA